MNKGVLTVGIILLAIMSLLMINIISNYSTGGEVDYYLVKETSEAAMVDALDTNFMALHGLLRIDKEKYVESFIRRFADNVNDTRNYTIGFYGLNEVPPKVSVKVDSLTTLSFEGESANISTSINQLAEIPKSEDRFVEYQLQNPNSAIGQEIEIKVHGNYNELILKKKKS